MFVVNTNMQLVPREVLFDVMMNAKPIQLVEAEQSAFHTFEKKAIDEYNKSNYDMDVFIESMLRFMKDNVDDIKYVGQGSSRVVFAMVNGTAFKLAKTKAGIAQNKQEAKVCMDPHMKY